VLPNPGAARRAEDVTQSWKRSARSRWRGWAKLRPYTTWCS